jgi:DNA-binding FrmR family transcriptional regulator
MSDEDKIPSGGSEEEYQFTDSDIDKELSQLDEEQVDAVSADDDISDGASEFAEQEEAPLEPPKKGLAKLFSGKFLSRKKLTIIVVIVVVLFVGAKMLSGAGNKAENTEAEMNAAPRSSVGIKPLSGNATSHSDDAFSSATPGSMAEPDAKTKLTPLQSPQNGQQGLSLPQPANGSALPGDLPAAGTESNAGASLAEGQQGLPAGMGVAAPSGEIKQLQSNDKKIVTQINKMEGKVSSVESDISSINAKLSMIANKIEAAEAMASVSAQAIPAHTHSANPLRESQTARAYHEPEQLSSRPEYSVEAVVPGRAWLQTKEGRTLTVTVGEEVSGYGRVVAINSYNGKVTMSTGKVIKYGTGV